MKIVKKLCVICAKRYPVCSVKFYSVPKNEIRRQRWVDACGAIFSEKSVVCEKHFTQADFCQSQHLRSLMPGAVPSMGVVETPEFPDHGLETIPEPLPPDSHMIHRGVQIVSKPMEKGNESKFCVICGKRYLVSKFKFYKVPNCDVTRQRWVDTCGLVITPNAFVCEKHFMEQDFIGSTKKLKPSSVPLLCAETFDELNDDQHDDVEEMEELSQSCMNMVECGVQTDFCSDKPNSSNRLEIDSLKRQIEMLKAKNTKILLENERLKTSLSTIFTKGQVKKLMYPDAKISWTWEDILNAICCHAAGPKAYRYYYEKGFPLPHFATLQAWIRKIKVDEGILSYSIDWLKSQKNLPLEEKICVISFGELKLQETNEHDTSTETVSQPSKYVQMAIVRGLQASWQQPIYLSFDSKITKTIINEIISALHESSFPVVAIVSDIGQTNEALWTELEASIEKPWFQHPVDILQKVFVFADVPHLIELVRNHFLDTGLLLDDKHIRPQTIQQVIQNAKVSDVSIIHKLTDEHLTVWKSGRQKVELAAQLFSNSTAAAIRRCHELGMYIYLPLETSEFIKLVNDWFDIHNAKMTTFDIPGKRPFGLDLPQQLQILDRMNAIMEKPLLPGKTMHATFQKGILLSNKALRMLHQYVSDRYGLSYVVSSRCNQDILENFFSAMRSTEGLYEDATPMQFKNRLQKHMLGNYTAKNIKMLSSSRNADVDETSCLKLSTDESLNNINEHTNLTQLELDAAINELFSIETEIQQSGNLEDDLENVDVDEMDQAVELPLLW